MINPPHTPKTRLRSLGAQHLKSPYASGTVSHCPPKLNASPSRAHTPWSSFSNARKNKFSCIRLQNYSCSASFHLILKYPDVPAEPSPSDVVSVTPPPPPPEPPNSLFTGSCALDLFAFAVPDVQI